MINTSMITAPAGSSKITELVKSFYHGGRKLYYSVKTEERIYEESVIVEKEMTRVSRHRDGISIYRVNTITENGAVIKLVEYAVAQLKGDRTDVRRRQRITKDKLTIRETEIYETQSGEFLSHFGNDTLCRYALCVNRK